MPSSRLVAVVCGSLMIQVSFAPPPREEFTTMLPVGRDAGQRQVGQRASAGADAGQVDERAQVDVPRLQRARRRASGAIDSAHDLLRDPAGRVGGDLGPRAAATSAAEACGPISTPPPP